MMQTWLDRSKCRVQMKRELVRRGANISLDVRPFRNGRNAILSFVCHLPPLRRTKFAFVFGFFKISLEKSNMIRPGGAMPVSHFHHWLISRMLNKHAHQYSWARFLKDFHYIDSLSETIKQRKSSPRNHCYGSTILLWIRATSKPNDGGVTNEGKSRWTPRAMEGKMYGDIRWAFPRHVVKEAWDTVQKAMSCHVSTKTARKDLGYVPL